MTESIMGVYERLFGEPRRESASAPVVEAGPASLVLEDPATGRVTITTPLVEVASSGDSYLRKLSGRLVEAGRANRNGALWTTEDLAFGLPSVAHGPLNVGHESAQVVGVLTAASLQPGEGEVGPHIRTDATLWRWVRPDLTEKVERALDKGAAAMSMECVASHIECTGPNGCGQVMEYAAAVTRSKDACKHVRERSSVRRFVEPFFMGSAIILAPDRPAWPRAELTLAEQRAVASAEESTGLFADLPDSEIHRLVSAVVAWTHRQESSPVA